MTNYDLPAALKKYREEHKISLSKMGILLNMSKSAYYRLEKGLREPYHFELVILIEKLSLQVDPKDVASIPNTAPKWNRPRKSHLFIPVLTAFVILSMAVEMRGFREAYGEEQIAAGHHFLPLFIFGAVFCAIYWFYLPPIMPKRKPNRLELMYGAAGLTIFLLLFFFEELVMPVLRWAGSYLDNKPAGLWIALTFISLLVALCIRGFRNVISNRIRILFKNT